MVPTGGCSPTASSWISASRSCSTTARQRQLSRCAFMIGTITASYRRLQCVISTYRPQYAISCPADCRYCFALLRRLHSIRLSVPSAVYTRLWTSLLCWRTRLDYSNTLAGIPSTYAIVFTLQSVLNADPWLIAGLRRSTHISDTIASFHWLRASERIQFKPMIGKS